MSFTVTDIKIITQQAIALSSDAAKLNRQLQQLLNSLVPGERIQAVLDVQTIKQQEIPVLKINDVVVPISKEQVAQLPLTTDRPIEFKVQSVDDQQLKLQLVSTARTPVTATDPWPEEVIDKKPQDHTRVLNVLQQIHGENTRKSNTEPGLNQQSDRPQPVAQHVNNKTIDSRIVVNNPVPEKVTSQQASELTNNQQVTKTGSTNKQVSGTQHATPDVAIEKSSEKVVPAYNQPVITVSTSSRSESQTNQPESGQIRLPLPGESERPVIQTQLNSTTQEKSVSSQSESIRTPEINQGKINTTVQLQGSFVQGSEPSAPNIEPSAPNIEPSAVIKEPVAGNKEQAQPIQASSNKPTETAVQGNTGIQNYTQPRLEIPVEIPNQQQFPILAQSVIAESQRVVQSQSSSLTAQLNKLFAQLDRLNQWHNDNKRQLRSQAGQQLNKASGDIRGGLEELKRYLVKPGQMFNQTGVKKAIRHSGSFLEQKQEGARTAPRNSQPSFHQDTKGNLQRLVSATLYHTAKLSVQSQGTTSTAHTGQSANLVTSQGMTTNASSTTTQSTPKSDLLLKIKQRLHAFGDKSIPQELPRQLLQLLRQILTLSSQSLSQSQLQQLANLRPDNLAPQWFFEIPIFQQEQAEPLQLLIKQEQDKDEQQQDKIWTLVLQFDIRQLGKIRAILQWQSDHITIRFLSEQQNTAELIESELDYVRQLIRDRQLTLNELEVTQAQLDDLKVSAKEVANV